MILMFTEYGSNYQGIADITVPLMQRYAKKHGYHFCIIKLDGTGNDYAFQKHVFMQRQMEIGTEVDAFFYLDVDAMPTNHKVKVEDFITEDADMFISRHVELNGGAMILKASMGGYLLNHAILAQSHLYENEQNVINAFAHSGPLKKRIKEVPHPSFNSLRYDLYPEYPNHRTREQGHWHEGDFVLHVPGLGIEHRIEVLKNTKIIE